MDPLTRRAIRLKSTVKTEQQAQIELGRLLKETSEARTPESGATVAKLMGIGTGVIRHALESLAADGLIIARHGRPRHRRGGAQQ